MSDERQLVDVLRDTQQRYAEERADRLVASLVTDGPVVHEITCPTCKGEGIIGGKTGFSYDYPWPCSDCKGSGKVLVRIGVLP